MNLETQGSVSSYLLCKLTHNERVLFTISSLYSVDGKIWFLSELSKKDTYKIVCICTYVNHKSTF